MNKVTQAEHKKLTENGFDLVPSRAKNEYRRILRNGDFETIIKDGYDDYTYHYDVNVNADDLEKANGNKTEYGLDWEEIEGVL